MSDTAPLELTQKPAMPAIYDTLEREVRANTTEKNCAFFQESLCTALFMLLPPAIFAMNGS
jgi:hypothetical protein